MILSSDTEDQQGEADNSSPDRPMIDIVVGATWHLDWKQETLLRRSNYSRQIWTWRIATTTINHGFVLQFFRRQLNGHLAIYETVDSTDRQVSSLNLAPVFVRSSVMRIVVAHDLKILLSSSQLKIKFQVHPLTSLPLAATNTMYSCTGISQIPEIIVCDSVRHCEGGEDEENCAGKDVCGNWFPYKDYCLKGFFLNPNDNISISISHGHELAPLTFNKYCKEMHDATLALLPDNEGIKIARRIIQNSHATDAVIGLRKMMTHNQKLRHLYRYMWQWGESQSYIALEQVEIQRHSHIIHNNILKVMDCAVLGANEDDLFACSCLGHYLTFGYICMRPQKHFNVNILQLNGLHFTKPTKLVVKPGLKQCRDGSWVQKFHRCRWQDMDTAVLGVADQWSINGFPLFPCVYGPPIHYSLVCDGKGDCEDNSDELDCKAPQLEPLKNSTFVCRNLQAIPVSQHCDGYWDCFDESDEENCLLCGRQYPCPGVGCVYYEHVQYIPTCPTIPKSFNVMQQGNHIIMDGHGMSLMDNLTNSESCSEGFFQCHSSYCIPTYLVNNDERDCPMGEDEGIPVENMTCPGYYRCQNSGSCIHPNYLCNGVHHCPEKDDEMFCKMNCPQGCICEGLVFQCLTMIDPLQNLHMRYLDLSYAYNVSTENIHFMEYLIVLNISSCNLRHIYINSMPQLRALDISHNNVSSLSSAMLLSVSQLKYLNISHNVFITILDSSFRAFLIKANLQKLESLTMAEVGVHTIVSDTFSPLRRLNHLDITFNPLQTFFHNSLRGPAWLKDLHTDNPKLCCGYFHEIVPECHAPVDALSSCSDLLAQDVLRVFVWLLTVLAIAGNGGVLIYRFKKSKRYSSSPNNTLVQNLCMADLLMGVYMLMIGVADVVYKKVYVEKEEEWRRSIPCTVAGFLSFTSAGTSSLLISVITLERVLVIGFGFKKRFHLSRRSTIIICCMIWVLGLTIATTPLLAGLEFYGYTGICIPLPITGPEFSGKTFAFSIFICLNFVLFAFTGAGQALIYVKVRMVSTSVGIKHGNRHAVLAQRLFLVVITDFLCKFPITLVGFLADGGVSIPGIINVWAAIFVLPFNSAFNPFLYTLNGVLQQRQRRREAERVQRMLGRLQEEVTLWPASSVEKLFKVCLASKLVNRQSLLRWMGISTSENRRSAELSSQTIACNNAN